jgi:hypothetical protein
VFAPFRDKSLTGFPSKGIYFIPAASPDRSKASHGASSGAF